MRTFTRFLDNWLRRALGVHPFCDEETCILRLQITKASRRICLPRFTMYPGEPVLALHLWNEHVPPLPPAGPTLAWATQMLRLFVLSLHLLAGHMRRDPGMAGIRALSGSTGVLAYGAHDSGEHVISRLGFSIVPCHNPLGRFGEFWENLYAWWLMDAFNPVSLNRRDLLHLHRTEFWMPAGEFLSRYGPPTAESAATALENIRESNI